MAGRPQSLTKGQREEVLKLFREKLSIYLLTFLAIFTGITGVGVWQVKTQIETKLKAVLEKSIATEFEQDRIKATISDVAKEKATVLLNQEIQPGVETFKAELAARTSEAEVKLKGLQAHVDRANTITLALEAKNEFLQTVIAAKNDDRAAFDTLERWSKDETYEYRMDAMRAWEAILIEGVERIAFDPGDFPWKPGIKPGSMSMETLVEQFNLSPSPIKRPLLKYIWKRDDLPLLNRLDFLLNVVKTHESIMVAEQAARYFMEGSEYRINPRAFSMLASWWREHRGEFVNGGDTKWPSNKALTPISPDPTVLSPLDLPRPPSKPIPPIPGGVKISPQIVR